jgi:hypothetical protein
MAKQQLSSYGWFIASGSGKLSNITRKETAFKHPRCGGVILICEENGRVTFECDTCGAQAVQLEVLAVGKPVILRRGSKKSRRSPETTAD